MHGTRGHLVVFVEVAFHAPLQQLIVSSVRVRVLSSLTTNKIAVNKRLVWYPTYNNFSIIVHLNVVRVPEGKAEYLLTIVDREELTHFLSHLVFEPVAVSVVNQTIVKDTQALMAPETDEIKMTLHV
jgi:hypothetical protein